MGLSKGEESRPEASPVLGWLLPGIIALVAVLLLLAGDDGREVLRFDRSEIASGEIWRLVTGHIVHLGLSHTLLNVAGLVLVWFLVGREFDPVPWLWVVAASIAAIDLGLWLLSPGLQWYVGLSGLLHGMLVAGVIAGFGKRKLESLVIGFIVAGKLAYEQWMGPLPGSESTSGGIVIVDAHLYGVIGGALAALLIIRFRRSTPI